jgi:hypothetical protein
MHSQHAQCAKATHTHTHTHTQPRAVAHSQGPSVMLVTRNVSMGANQAQTCCDEVFVIKGLVTLRSDAIDHGLVHLVLAWSISWHGVGTVK